VGKAEEMLADMREAGIAPDSTSLNAVLSACCSAGEFDRAVEMAAAMREDGFQPDTVQAPPAPGPPGPRAGRAKADPGRFR
jgi:pentatricopeptide repeat protein